ncbi:MAG: tRNA (cytidine(34)-2'-O)-methyltransferase [Gammaproteobacteria bacterium]|nr:tRNA (cytidine(34)-2'-O)-methyltransferase [Gammaproteobacteria bacterium]
MFHVALYEPEIPPNTGNIIRLCANTGSTLHLIHPLGFKLEDRLLRRAGLDYHDLANLRQYQSLDQFRAALQNNRLFACSTRGNAAYTSPAYRPDDVLLFGPESRGLPQQLLDEISSDQLIRIPMRPGNRSLNLSNAVAIVLYEAWRQLEFV